VLALARVNSIVMLLRLSLTVLLLTLACSRAQIKSSQPRNLIVAAATPTTSPTPPEPIRLIDFNYVAFPNYPVYIGDRVKKKYVTLKPGDGGPALLNYGDVTGDGAEEAMMMLGIETRGSAIPEIVYIFTLQNTRPKLLWSFETGDRADGGFRNAYADHGELVVELYGKNRVIGSNLYLDDEAACCPSSFTRARYRWDGIKFQLAGTPEVLPNPSHDGNSVMSYYDGPSK
jgi:hypothetical protein